MSRAEAQVCMERETSETRVRVCLRPGSPAYRVDMPLCFLAHMLEQMGFYGLLGLEVEARGDLAHHVAEDTAIVLGKCLGELRRRTPSARRYGWAAVPMDDALVLVAVDLGGRPYASVDLGLEREVIEDTASEDIVHFLETLAFNAGAALHARRLAGSNDHHVAEACFKALGMALRMALEEDPARRGVASTKGVIG